MKKVFLLMVFGLILSGCVQGNGDDKNASTSPVYSTQEECEEKNDCECGFVMCDYVPAGKTFEEVCGKDFKEGWKCINTAVKEGVIEMSKTVESGDTIKVEYIGSFPDTKEVFDKSDGNPLEFVAGAGQMIKGFDSAVIGMKLNQEKTVVIPPEEAYGAADSGQEVEVPLSQIEGGTDLNVGSILYASNGQQGTVIEIKDNNTAIIKFIHPMAGKTLQFWIKVVEINKK